MAATATALPAEVTAAAGAVYDEVEIEDMQWNAEESTFYYACPCGDRFFITLEDLAGGEDIASCPSCSLRIRVVFDPEALESIVGKEAIEALTA